MVEVLDVTDEYDRRKNPKSGRIIYEEKYNRDSHADEIKTAEWLWNTFGGDIVLLKESTKQNEERPDYLWSDKYWERKGIHSVKDNTIDLRIRKGYSQIEGRRGV